MSVQRASTETEEGVKTPGFSIKNLFGGDKVLWIVIAALAIVSLLVVYSSTASMAYRKLDGNTAHYFVNQLRFIFLSFVTIWVVHKLNVTFYYKIANIAFYASLGLMLLTFIIGVNMNDASRWLPIPFIGLTFQPSDILRIAVIMILAKRLAQFQNEDRDIKSLFLFPSLRLNLSQNTTVFKQVSAKLLMPIVVSCALILPSNFSTSAITFFTCWIILVIGRVRMRELWRLLAVCIVIISATVAVMATLNVGRAQTWVSRIENFANFDKEQGEQSSDKDLQVEQAKIAIATGGIIGKGPGNSTQRANLPHSYSDFAYAFIVEEYGLIGGAIVLILYLWLLFRTIIIFRRCKTAFPSFLVLGLGVMIVLQAMVNMAVSVSIFPVTGQTLPLISLGGSSMIFTSMALGMILGVSRQIQQSENEENEKNNS